MDFVDIFFNLFWIVLYLIITVLFVALLVGLIAWILRRKREKASQYSLTFLQIKLPKENETEIQAAEQMFSGFAGTQKGFFSSLFSGKNRISLEIVSRTEGIGFYVIVPDNLVTLVEKQINGANPDAEIDIVDPNEV